MVEPLPEPGRVFIRDPLWDTIELDPAAVRILDARAFQRLRYIKQLGLAYLVYPGATHTRFDHALGVYHLARRAIEVLRAQAAAADVDPLELRLVPLAGLLHDVGHYPFSHALEELDASRIPGHHEALVGRFLEDPEIRDTLAGVSAEAPAAVEALIRGKSGSPLQGLVSGSLDLDKIEYLKRDARFCGVPYGEVDVDRLLHSLSIVSDPETGRLEVGVTEKGVAALESLLFAKYQMFRNVYWHHAVRAATALYKRMIAEALDAGLLESDELVGKTDEAILFLLESRSQDVSRAGDPAAERVGAWVRGLRHRQLPKRAAEVVSADLDGRAVGDWLILDTAFKRRVEDRIAQELGLGAGQAFLDYPEKTQMFGLDLLVRTQSGEVVRVGPRGRAGLIGLPRVADELYRTARVLRLFTLGERRRVDPAALASLATLSRDDVARRLAGGEPLIAA